MRLLALAAPVVILASTGVAVAALVAGALPLVAVSKKITLRATCALAIGLAVTWLDIEEVPSWLT